MESMRETLLKVLERFDKVIEQRLSDMGVPAADIPEPAELWRARKLEEYTKRISKYKNLRPLPEIGDSIPFIGDAF